MKIAVTAQGCELESELDPRFGRASCFIVVDTDSGEHEIVDNTQNLNAAQGAGVQAAQTIVNQRVDAVLTGHCGPKAFSVLDRAGIKVYLGAEGLVGEAIEQVLAGEYQAALMPDVEGHW
jgi:predicted Fe-Mo cluster-binding NifX family protein